MKRLLLFVLLAAPVIAQAQSPQDLYQEALRLEQSQGDLSGAIVLYQRVAADYGGDRGLGALALLKIGQAYEQLGETEAERAYRRIVAEFGDQEETVAAAREALGRLVEPTANGGWETLSPVIAGEMIYAGRISRDGRYFAASDQRGLLAYQEKGAPEPVFLTPSAVGEDGTPNAFEWTSAFSPDGKQLAFARLGYDTGHMSIRVHDLESGQNREVLNLNEYLESDAYAEAYDWTSDGREILITLEKRLRGDNGMQLDSTFLGTLDVSTGIMTRSVYLPVERGFDYQMACLLEDRYALVNGSVADDLDGVLRVDLENGGIEPFWPDKANTRLLGCSDRENVVAIRSDFFGEGYGYLATVGGGRPVGTPVRIPGVSDRFDSIGVTDDGVLHVLEKRGVRRVELYGVSRDGRELTGRSTILQDDGWSRLLGWSRSGEVLAHFDGAWKVNRYDPADGRLLDTVDLSSLEVSPARFNRFRLTPDGSSLLLVRISDGVDQAYLVDLSSVAVSDSLIGVYPTVGMEGRSLVWAERRDSTTMCVLESSPPYERRQAQVCYPDDYGLRGGLAQLSPDGSLVNVGTTSNEEWPRLGHTTVVEVQTGKVLLTWATPEGQSVVWENWAPDGRSILMQSGPPEEMGFGGKMYRLDVETGEQEEVLTSLTETRLVWDFKVDPIRSQILLTTQEKADTAGSTRLQMKAGLWDLLKE